MRIEICGGIASGKTTLAKLLSRVDMHPVYEDFTANPFYKAFYRDPSANAFETEITFLLQHFHVIREALTGGKFFCCDYSLTLDAAYADVTLRPKHRKIFSTVFHEARSIVGAPALLIQLKCDPVEELRRIRRRRRKSELAVTKDYLIALNNALAKRVVTHRRCGKVLEIDSWDMDFAHDDKAKSRVTDMVLRALRLKEVLKT